MSTTSEINRKKNTKKVFRLSAVGAVIATIGLSFSGGAFAAPTQYQDGQPVYINKKYEDIEVTHAYNYGNDIARANLAEYKIISQAGEFVNKGLQKRGLDLRLPWAHESSHFVFIRQPGTKYYRIQRVVRDGMHGEGYPGGHQGEWLTATGGDWIQNHGILEGWVPWDKHLWELRKHSGGYYHIINKSNGGFITAHDHDGSTRDVRLSFGLHGESSLKTRWRLEVAANHNGLKIDGDSTLIYYSVEPADLDPSQINLSTVDVVQKGKQKIDNGTTSNDGTLSVNLGETTVERDTISTSRSVAHTFEHNHSVTLSKTTEVGGSGKVFSAKVAFGISTTNGISFSKATTNTNGQQTATERRLTRGGIAQINHTADQELEIIYSHKSALLNYPYRAVVVREYSDGYREEAEVITGTVNDVTVSDFEYLIIDKKASVFYPYALSLEAALKRNAWDVPSNNGEQRTALAEKLAQVSANSSEDYLAMNARDLIFAGFVHYWTKKAQLVAVDNVQFLTHQEKLDRILKYVALNSSDSIVLIGNNLNHFANRYKVLEKAALLNTSRSSLRKIPLVPSNIGVRKAMYLANYLPFSQLLNGSDDHYRNLMISNLHQLSTATVSELQALSNDELIALFLMQREMKKLDPNVTNSVLSTWSLNYIRDSFISIMDRTGKANLDIPGMHKRDNYRLMQAYYLHNGSELIDHHPEASSGVGSGGEYEIVVGLSDLCFDMLDFGTNDGTKLIQWNCVQSSNQRFVFEPKSGDTFAIRSVHSNKYLQGENPHQWGSPIVQMAGNNADNQRWKFLPKGNGFGQFQSVSHPGFCIDLRGSSMDLVGDMIIYNCHDGENQLFKPVKL